MQNNSPYLRQPASVRSVMLRVMLALLPGVAAYVWWFGPAILIQLALVSLAALAGEALMLKLRQKPLWQFLGDGSALLTAWLTALAFPPLTPWWLTISASLFAIIIVKQLYGGLGQNPFNPAMAAFCVMIVAFPQLMSQWPAPLHGAGFDQFSAHAALIFGSSSGRELDAITMATALDSWRTTLHSSMPPTSLTSSGQFGGLGWEWIAAGYLIGGLWLIQQRIITWHIPTAFIATMALCAALAHGLAPERHAGALFHLASCGAMLGAFFIATDPVSAATTPRGKLIFGAGVGLLAWLIRSFGAYPDGVAFAVLLMNIAAPLIDLRTQPAIFGHKKS